MSKHDPGSQCARILFALQSGYRLTRKDMRRLTGADAGSQRIANLRDDGWKIEKDMIKVAPRTHVAEYYLDLEYHKEDNLYSF